MGDELRRLLFFINVGCDHVVPAGMAGLTKIGLRPAICFNPKYCIWRPVMKLGAIVAAHFAVFPFLIYRYFVRVQACGNNSFFADVFRYQPFTVLALVTILPGACCVLLFNQFIKSPTAIFAGYTVVSNGSK